MYFKRVTSAGGAKSLLDVAQHKMKVTAERYSRELGAAVTRAAKEWRTWAKIKLSSPCAARSSGHNSTGYPGRCSGDLERSLHYRTYHKVRGRSLNYHVVAGWVSEFTPFVNTDGIDYGEKLDRTFIPYKGYKARIYKAMDDFLSKAIRRHEFKGRGI